MTEYMLKLRRRNERHRGRIGALVLGAGNSGQKTQRCSVIGGQSDNGSELFPIGNRIEPGRVKRTTG